MLTQQHQALLQAARTITDQYSEDELLNIFLDPLVILSAPRAGSTLLFETLSTSEEIWSIGGESHFIFNAFPELHPRHRNYDSGRLTSSDADGDLCHLMRACFLLLAKNRSGTRLLDLPESARPAQIRLLEKTPRNALNLPFMLRLFPGMQAIFLHRDPRQNIASIIAAWEQGLTNGKFVTFPHLPGWGHRRWCLLLPPGWKKLDGRPLAEIATFQWCAANHTILEDLQLLEQDRWISIEYQNLVDKPMITVKGILEFAGITLDPKLHQRLSSPLPLSKTCTSKPTRDKWKKYAHDIQPLYEAFMPLASRLRATDRQP